jgi:hypothetical protein
MILDVKKVGEAIKYQKPVAGTFYVLEQMPGKIYQEDMTDPLFEVRDNYYFSLI